jgi:hypothetical protein
MEGRHAGVGAEIRGPYELNQLPGPAPAPCSQQLFSNLLLQRLSPRDELSDHQYGFRHGHRTADALFALDATVRPRVQRVI